MVIAQCNLYMWHGYVHRLQCFTVVIATSANSLFVVHSVGEKNHQNRIKTEQTSVIRDVSLKILAELKSSLSCKESFSLGIINRENYLPCLFII